MKERYQCTPERPWKQGDPTPVEHSNVVAVGPQRDGYPGGDIQRQRCENCGIEWDEELPQ